MPGTATAIMPLLYAKSHATEDQMIYATTDNRSTGTICQDAHIVAFETEEEARAYLLESYSDDSEFDLAKAEIFPGSYGDCWLKLLDEPGDDWTCEPFARDQLTILRPGQHPGTRAWWVEPFPPVLIAVVPLKSR